MVTTPGQSETLTKFRKYTVRGLNHQLKQLCRHNREGSYGTQVRRERELTLIANQLHALGYRGMNDHSLKPKHVEGLVRKGGRYRNDQEPYGGSPLVGPKGESPECGGALE